MVELGSLGCKMAGNPRIEPALDLSGQMENFDGHNRGPLQTRFRKAYGHGNRVTPRFGVRTYIHVVLTDFNIC